MDDVMYSSHSMYEDSLFTQLKRTGSGAASQGAGGVVVRAARERMSARSR